MHVNRFLASYLPLDGSRIMFDSAVSGKRAMTRDTVHVTVDIRDLLSGADSRVLQHKATEILGGTSDQPPRDLGGFDARVRTLWEFCCTRIRYQFDWYRGRPQDLWQYPEETLALRRGDCEDKAILLAALLLASGVSPFCVRVALGRLHWPNHKRTDHAWVLYRDERGVWRILETTLTTSSWDMPDAAQLMLPGSGLAYEPEFVFNRHHLWIVDRPDDDLWRFVRSHRVKHRRTSKRSRPSRSTSFDHYVTMRQRLAHLDTRFWYKVHEDILGRALDGVARPDEIETFVKVNWSLDAPTWLGGEGYRPREHFDNALIDESFTLAQFNIDTKELPRMGKALHAVGDFYAHSSYMEIAVAAYGASNRVPPYYEAIGDARFQSVLGAWTYSWDSSGKYSGRLVSGAYAPGDAGIDPPAKELTLSHDDYAADGKAAIPLISSPGKNNDLYLTERIELAAQHIRWTYRKRRVLP